MTTAVADAVWKIRLHLAAATPWCDSRLQATLEDMVVHMLLLTQMPRLPPAIIGVFGLLQAIYMQKQMQGKQHSGRLVDQENKQEVTQVAAGSRATVWNAAGQDARGAAGARWRVWATALRTDSECSCDKNKRLACCRPKCEGCCRCKVAFLGHCKAGPTPGATC